MGEFRFVTRLDSPQERQLCQLFSGEWWCRNRTPEQTRRLLEGPSLVCALVEPATGRLAAFARVVTDGVFKAWIFDVIVAPAFRGRGVGRRLLEQVTRDPRLAGVAHVELYCLAELVPFYGRFGFRPPQTTVQLLRREQVVRPESEE